MRNTEIRRKNTKKNVNTQITNVKILIFNKIFCFQVERRMKCISLLFRLSDSYNFPASLTSRFRKMVHNGPFLKLYIPTTLKFDRKAEIPPLAPFTSVLHKEQSAATVCIRQHALNGGLAEQRHFLLELLLYLFKLSLSREGLGLQLGKL